LRFFDVTFSLDDVRQAYVHLTVDGDDGFFIWTVAVRLLKSAVIPLTWLNK
jgi:fumarylacetoacetate (FAA) hydrolase family protein